MKRSSSVPSLSGLKYSGAVFTLSFGAVAVQINGEETALTFCFFTTAFVNAYLTILKKHYKHINIKKDLMQKLLSEMESYPGMNSATSLSRSIKQYIDEDAD